MITNLGHHLSSLQFASLVVQAVANVIYVCPGSRGTAPKKNVVYEIRCKLCHQSESNVGGYVGESMRPVRLRYNEHRRNAINKTPNTPFGDHFLNEHSHDELPNNADILHLKVVYRAHDHPDRKIAESIIIRTRAPAFNIQGSSWPIMRAV